MKKIKQSIKSDKVQKALKKAEELKQNLGAIPKPKRISIYHPKPKTVYAKIDESQGFIMAGLDPDIKAYRGAIMRVVNGKGYVAVETVETLPDEAHIKDKLAYLFPHIPVATRVKNSKKEKWEFTYPYYDEELAAQVTRFRDSAKEKRDAQNSKRMLNILKSRKSLNAREVFTLIENDDKGRFEFVPLIEHQKLTALGVNYDEVDGEFDKAWAAAQRALDKLAINPKEL